MGGLGLYIADRVFEDMPRLTGLPLVRHGKQWWGACRMSGENHPRKDKLKVYIWNGRVYLHEEGGDTLGVDRWLIQYGGANDKNVWRILRGDGSYWTPPVRKEAAEEEPEIKYVGKEALEALGKFPLERCPLFRWMSGLFGEEKVREAWKRYHVTTDTYGKAVFWYVDKEGRILHDKRLSYGEDGHRLKERAPGRKFKVDDGFSGRCLFGEDSAGDGACVYVVESEKSALLGYLYWGKPFVATGGKSNIRLVKGRDCILCPDMDARQKWNEYGEVWRWWDLWCKSEEEIPRTADIGDMVVNLVEKNLVV